MNKGDLQSLVTGGLSQREIGRRVGISQVAVRYWLKRFGIKTICTPRIAPGTPCRLCGGKVKGDKVRSRCQACNTRVRRMRCKLAAIALLGGKCKRCGWSGPPAGFDFHHVAGKDVAIGQVANKSWNVVKRELKKCELLCRICHAIHHSKHVDAQLMVEVESYRGKALF